MYLSNYPVRAHALAYRFLEFPLKNQMLSDRYLEMMGGGMAEEEAPFFDMGRAAHRSLIDQALYAETKMRLLNLTLPLSDKMSMANSVELRPVFLDHDLVNYVFRIPDRYKIKALSEKHILKESMKGFLPEGVCKRKKQPLQPPGKWFVRAFYPMISHYLSEKMVQRKGYFNPLFIKGALAGHDESSNLDLTGAIVVAFFVHLWDEIFLN
jgi:asparagine synthase (glutamine-hydrolysing)